MNQDLSKCCHGNRRGFCTPVQTTQTCYRIAHVQRRHGASGRLHLIPPPPAPHRTAPYRHLSLDENRRTCARSDRGSFRRTPARWRIPSDRSRTLPWTTSTLPPCTSRGPRCVITVCKVLFLWRLMWRLMCCIAKGGPRCVIPVCIWLLFVEVGVRQCPGL